MATTQELFNSSYISGYETSSSLTRAYETSSRAIAALLHEFVPDQIVVGEIGSGTGNSATVLLENNKNIRQLYCIEPSNFIWYANKKRLGDLSSEVQFPIPEYSAEMALRMSPFAEKLHFVQGKAEQLPIISRSLDAICMCQVFHWLDPEKALSEIRRVLKPDGVLIFDESGYQFDFGETNEGKQLNQSHVTKHPTFIAFQKEFNRLLVERSLVSSSTSRPFSYLFDENLLIQLLHANGFEVQPRDKKKLYQVVTVPYSLSMVQAVTEHGARMRIGRDLPELLNHPETTNSLIEGALRYALNQSRSESDSQQYQETFALFSATPA